jgi:hypothetical protein
VVVAGTGESAEVTGERGDGGPATEATFIRVDGLDAAGDGSILVADSDDERVRIILPNGNIHSSGADIGQPLGVISSGWAPNDVFFEHNMIVADSDEDQVEEWTFLANGDWREAVAIEDIQATDVEDASNGIWVADPDNGTVWHATFNSFLLSWDASPALEGLDDPRGVGSLPVIGFLVATRGGDCVIRRRANGVTQVVAGKEGQCLADEFGPEGNGGPATAARLNQPTDVEATPDGGFVFIERYRLRRVAPDGTLSSLYATGLWTNPDFPPPDITALDVTADGDVLIARGLQVLRFDTNYGPQPDPGSGNPSPSVPGPSNPGPGNTSPVKAIAQLRSKAAVNGVAVSVLCQSANGCLIGATGVVSIPNAALSSRAFKLNRVKPKRFANGQRARLTLKLPAKTRKAVSRALRKKRFRRKVTAKITVTDTSVPGSPTSLKKTVRFGRG